MDWFLYDRDLCYGRVESKPLTIIRKRSIIDVWQGSKYIFVTGSGIFSMDLRRFLKIPMK